MPSPYTPSGYIPPAQFANTAGGSTGESNGIATAAMVVGIIGLVTFFLCGLGVLLGIVAIVLGAIGLSKANKIPGRTGRGQAIAGLITGVIAVVIAALFLGLIIFAGSSADDINTDPSDGFCDDDRYMQDPDC